VTSPNRYLQYAGDIVTECLRQWTKSQTRRQPPKYTHSRFVMVQYCIYASYSWTSEASRSVMCEALRDCMLLTASLLLGS